MKIVHITDVLYPEAGYLVNILAKYEALDGDDVMILAPPADTWMEERKEFWGADDVEARDKNYEEDAGVKVVRYPIIREVAGRIMFEKGFYDFVVRQKPDIVFIHSESSFQALHYLLRYRRQQFPIILGSHMLDIAAANRFRNQFYLFYRATFAKIISHYGIYVIRTQDDDYVMRRLGVPAKNAPYISFGSDLAVFHRDKSIGKLMRTENNIHENDFVVIVTGKLTEGKGGLLLAEAFRKKFHTKRNVVLVIVGTMTNDDYGKKVKDILDECENRVIYVPTQKYTNLAKYYQMSDIAVFAKQCSLSFYDAQACGLPVVLENNKLNIKRISHHNGIVFKMNDVADFRNKIEYFINLDINEIEKYSVSAAEDVKQNYNYANVNKQYKKLMKVAIKRFEKMREKRW